MWPKGGREVGELTKEKLLKHLRDALNHLRDPNYLRQSPLSALFGVANRPETPTALRSILIEAIKSLRPDDNEPAQSPAWRLYESLFYRYVQHFSQSEIADQLGISPRQLRREQHTALEALTHRLWEQFNIDADSVEAQAAEGVPAGNTVYEDLAWLKDAPPETPTDLDRELPIVLELARSLAGRYEVELNIIRDDALPQLATNPVAFRQTLLTLLGVAIPRAPCSQVRISTQALPGEVEIAIRCETPPFGTQPIEKDDDASLNMAHRLTELCQGRLTISAADKAFGATLSLPALGQLPVLAIDDNAGTLNLLQRYLAGTRYRLIGSRDPEEALSLAEQVSPRVIVLDVMMPSVDGWEVMGWLRQHPSTSHTPVVVCTILPEEELAFSLGASEFVRKPVTRQAFLAALDRLVASKETGSH
jgi:CheY-like chemotaxis protein